jgi:hypothetical protein
MGNRQRRRLREQGPTAVRFGPNDDAKRIAEEKAIKGLRDLVVLRGRIEHEIDAEVDRLQGWGFGWPVIARGLGVTRQAARQRATRHRARSLSTEGVLKTK